MGLSSLPLQILLYFNRWLTLFYCIIELGSMIYKGVLLPYPPGVYGALIIQLPSPRVLIKGAAGTRGNKVAEVRSMILFIILSIPLLFAHIYYIVFQIYVLYVDLVINCIMLGVIGLELLISIWCIISFARAS